MSKWIDSAARGGDGCCVVTAAALHVGAHGVTEGEARRAAGAEGSFRPDAALKRVRVGTAGGI